MEVGLFALATIYGFRSRRNRTGRRTTAKPTRRAEEQDGQGPGGSIFRNILKTAPAWDHTARGCWGPRASDVQGQFRLLLSPSKQADGGATFPGLPGGLGGTVMMQAQIWCGSSWVRSWVGRDGTLLIDPSPRRPPQEMRRPSPTVGTDAVLGTVVRTSLVMKHRIPHQRGWPGVAVLYMGVCILR